MNISRLTPRQLILALGICAAIFGGGTLTLYLLDLRDQAAIRPEDVFTAVGQGDMSRVIQCLKAQPALANARDPKGGTPLHLAAERNLGDTTRVLLKLGADPSQKNAQGKTPLEVAREKGARAAAGVLEEQAGR